MEAKKESVFDTATQGFNLWEQKNITISLKENVIIHQCEVFKHKKNNEALKPGYIILTKDKLYFKESKETTEARGVMDINWTRVEFSLVSGLFCFRFVNNLKFSEFYFTEKDTALQFREKISKICIHTDFDQKYSSLNLVSKSLFANIFSAENKFTKKKVAVKIFPKDLLFSDTRAKYSLLAEIQMLRSLNHPNIVEIEEVHETNSSVFVVMELLEGKNLDWYFQTRKLDKLEDIACLIKVILNILMFLDQKKIIHRDIKPQNFLFKQKSGINWNSVKLVDFALATKADVSEYFFKRCGTPGYIAPEIIEAINQENVKYDTKCDVFSVGIILYTLLSGRQPFRGKNSYEILEQNKEMKFEFKELKQKIDSSAFDLLRKMLEVDPKKRLSAAQCLSQPFFIKFKSSSSELSNKQIPNETKLSDLVKGNKRNSDVSHLLERNKSKDFLERKSTLDNGNSSTQVNQFKCRSRRDSIFRSMVKKQGDIIEENLRA